jgi:hypothetical protein
MRPWLPLAGHAIMLDELGFGGAIPAVLCLPYSASCLSRERQCSPLAEGSRLAFPLFYRSSLRFNVLYCPFRVLTLVTPITTCAVPFGHLDPAGLCACSKGVSPLCRAHPIPCSRTNNSVLEERLRRRASAKLC